MSTQPNAHRRPERTGPAGREHSNARGQAGIYASAPSEASEDAGRWLAAQGDMTGRHVVAELRQRFGITSLQAVEAIRIANRLRRTS